MYDEYFNPDDVEWQDLALCRNNELHVDFFFNYYEQDITVRQNIDELCKSCPVRNECLDEGIFSNAIGVWGGVYLNNGRYDKQRNNHKPLAEQQELEELIDG
jgi:hypothetical protein